MAENKMKEVAELLGVEMDKYFKIDGFRNSLFKITNNGFISSDGWRDGVLDGLLTGRLEIEKPILDNIEKRYLENVLRPFKSRVMFISKSEDFDYEHIWIRVALPIHKHGNTTCNFPYFDKGTMYKGMELYKPYSLEELGLFENDGDEDVD